MTTAQNPYGLYHLPVSSLHRPAVQRVLRGQVYEAETVAFLRGNHNGNHVIHAGAYFGDMIPALAQSGAAHLWCFEPNAENHACAKQTIELNNLPNVTLYHAALGSQPGIAHLQTHIDGVALGGGSHISDNGDTVDMVTLDDCVPVDAVVSLIHLDIEGYEVSALQGASRIITMCRPVIVTEWLPAYRDMLTAFMTTLHYAGGEVLNNNRVWRSL